MGSEEIAKEMIKESLALNEEVVLKATNNKLSDREKIMIFLEVISLFFVITVFQL